MTFSTTALVVTGSFGCEGLSASILFPPEDVKISKKMVEQASRCSQNIWNQSL